MHSEISHHGNERNPQQRPGVSVLVADRRDHPAHHPEAETVKVTVTDSVAFMELDDGVWLGFDAGDLRAALAPELAQEEEQ